MLSEIADAGLIAIPNLYSVTNVDRAIWSKWLKDSPDVWIVSRDFSRTKATRSLKAEFGEMVEILSATGRAFHVILVGVALRNSLKIVPPLIELGHSCSIATSFPVLKGFGGLEIRFDNLSGQVEYVLKPDKTLVEIAEANLRVARKFFHRFMSYEAKESSPKKRIA